LHFQAVHYITAAYNGRIGYIAASADGYRQDRAFPEGITTLQKMTGSDNKSVLPLCFAAIGADNRIIDDPDKRTSIQQTLELAIAINQLAAKPSLPQAEVELLETLFFDWAQLLKDVFADCPRSQFAMLKVHNMNPSLIRECLRNHGAFMHQSMSVPELLNKHHCRANYFRSSHLMTHKQMMLHVMETEQCKALFPALLPPQRPAYKAPSIALLGKCSGLLLPKFDALLDETEQIAFKKLLCEHALKPSSRFVPGAVDFAPDNILGFLDDVSVYEGFKIERVGMKMSVAVHASPSKPAFDIVELTRDVGPDGNPIGQRQFFQVRLIIYLPESVCAADNVGDRIMLFGKTLEARKISGMRYAHTLRYAPHLTGTGNPRPKGAGYTMVSASYMYNIVRPIPWFDSTAGPSTGVLVSKRVLRQSVDLNNGNEYVLPLPFSSGNLPAVQYPIAGQTQAAINFAHYCTRILDRCLYNNAGVLVFLFPFLTAVDMAILKGDIVPDDNV
jgi:hypothetical protein